ncbi:hypothetical protein EON65_28570 [archaeon]|nr:MAG: hypothetical protein EON65_28570 [archaeon]
MSPTPTRRYHRVTEDKRIQIIEDKREQGNTLKEISLFYTNGIYIILFEISPEKVDQQKLMIEQEGDWLERLKVVKS